MRIWLEIDASDEGGWVLTQPALDGPAFAVTGRRHLAVMGRVGPVRRPLSVPGIAETETASVTVDLDNAAGAVSQAFGAAPPIRTSARLMTESGPLFSGVVTRISLAAAASVTLESGIRAPLTDTVPLRTSVAWGGFKEVHPLPVVYGRAIVTPVPYDAAGRLFVLADHPIAGVDRVTRDDAPTTAYAFRNGMDSTGRAVAFLELAVPLADGERLAATVRGKRHPATGRLLTSPAEILHDLLAQVCACPLDWSRFDAFRAETAGIELGGVIADPSASIRTTVDRLLLSVGAAWSAGAADVAMCYPSPVADTMGAAAIADRLCATNVAAETTHDGLITALRVTYDFDHAAGRPRRALLLTCREAIRRYGRIEAEWDAGWLRTPRAARALGERVLSWRCRPRWRIRWSQTRGATLQPGDVVELSHPHSPVAGRHRLLAADLDAITGMAECVIEAAVGDDPRVETTALSTAFEPILQSGATVEYRDGVAILTILDDAGQPIAGARATLDGGMTRIADALGRVAFPAARGKHLVQVEATGYAPMEIEVTL